MHSLGALLCVLGGLLAGAGLCLMLWPAQTRHTWARVLQVWRRTGLPALLHRHRHIEKPLYRHHRTFGAVVMSGAIVMATLLAQHATNPLGPGSASPAARIALLICWVLAGFILLMGAYLFIRPSALKRIEAVANRGVKLTMVDRAVCQARQAPRRAGALLLLLGVSMSLIGWLA